MALDTYTTDELISRVRTKAGWTDSSQLGAQDTDIIRALNEAMYTEIIPRLMKIKEEYLVITRRIPLVANEHRYRIPKRAAGQKLRDLYYIDSAGSRIRLPHISRENRHDYPDTAATEPEAYFLENTYIVLVPDLAGASGQLELAYFFRPGQLIKVANSRTIVSFADVGSETRLSFVGAAPATWGAGFRYDIHSRLSGAQPKAFDIIATEVNSGSSYIAFEKEDVDGSEYGADKWELGDSICFTDEAVVPGLPFELHPVLAQAAIVRLAEGQGDDTYQYHKAELDRMLQAAGYLYETRVEGQPKKIISRQGAWLYGGGRGW